MTVSEPESWKRVIEIELSEAEVVAAVDAKLRAYRRDVRLPGFRPGKVPIEVVRQRYGGAARHEAVEEAMQSSFKAACEEHGISPVREGKLLSNEDGGDGDGAVKFTIETEVDPPAEIRGYNGLGIRPKPAKATGAMVDAAYGDLIERFAEFEDVNRPAKKGDYLRLEYKRVAIDGTERPDLRNHSPSYPVELGGEGVFKEFDKGLAGRSAGDEAEITAAFPKGYADEGVAGKTGEFTVKVLSVQEKRLPEVNDAFLKRFGDFATAGELKEAVRKDVEANALRRAREEAQTEAIQTLIKGNTIELAPSKVDMCAKMLMEDQFKRWNMEGAEPTADQLEAFRDLAVTLLKRAKIIEYVADKENIKATQEEVDAEIMLMAREYGEDFQTLKQALRRDKDNGTNRLRQDIRERKTLGFLIGEGGAGSV
jgi:trigger factor